ncbi:MAG: hypothetical protein KTR31_33540 [Myxococcales bacterium]|nr:hypothetical protein [Myxococcales bacterium]
MPTVLMFAVVAHGVDFDTLVSDPAVTLLEDRNTPAGFRMIALSHAAEACVGRTRMGEMTLVEGQHCVARMAEAALHPRMSKLPDIATASDAALQHHGLALSHLGIVLGARDAASPYLCDLALHRRVVDQLVAQSLAHPSGVARSFPTSHARWPTDQAATLHAIHLFDRAHGTQRSREPLERFLVTALPADGSLPPTEITGSVADAAIPRGSSLSFLVRYLAPLAPRAAQTLWQRGLPQFLAQVGPMAGMREWPAGVDGPADIDSGPIVMGIGASATAFGEAAARAVADHETAAQLERTSELVQGMASADPALAKAANSALAAAISAQKALPASANAARDPAQAHGGGWPPGQSSW